MGDSAKNLTEINLSDLFEDAYSSPAELAEVLDLGMVMLFYLEEGSFSRREIQSVVEALRIISGVLHNFTRHEP